MPGTSSPSPLSTREVQCRYSSNILTFLRLNLSCDSLCFFLNHPPVDLILDFEALTRGPTTFQKQRQEGIKCS